MKFPALPIAMMMIASRLTALSVAMNVQRRLRSILKFRTYKEQQEDWSLGQILKKPDLEEANLNIEESNKAPLQDGNSDRNWWRTNIDRPSSMEKENEESLLRLIANTDSGITSSAKDR